MPTRTPSARGTTFALALVTIAAACGKDPVSAPPLTASSLAGTYVLHDISGQALPATDPSSVLAGIPSRTIVFDTLRLRSDGTATLKTGWTNWMSSTAKITVNVSDGAWVVAAGRVRLDGAAFGAVKTPLALDVAEDAAGLTTPVGSGWALAFDRVP